MDFDFQMLTPLGQSTFQLAELKVTGTAGSCYPRSWACARRKRGVERRAPKLIIKTLLMCHILIVGTYNKNLTLLRAEL